jgi:hypothetical protein
VKGKVGSSVETGLREVENAGEADDEPVNLSEGGEAEDFGGVVAVFMLITECLFESWNTRLTTRRCSRVGDKGRRG